MYSSIGMTQNDRLVKVDIEIHSKTSGKTSTFHQDVDRGYLGTLL